MSCQHNWDYLQGLIPFDLSTANLPLDRVEYVSFDAHTQDVKLYARDEDDHSLIKLSKNSILKHYFYPHPHFHVDIDRIYSVLNPQRKLMTIELHAFNDQDGLYFWVENASRRDFKATIQAAAQWQGCDEQEVIDQANLINGLVKCDADELYDNRAITMIRLGLNGRPIKLYSMPIRWQNPITFTVQQKAFLDQVYSCEDNREFESLFVKTVISYEFNTKRYLVIAQR